MGLENNKIREEEHLVRVGKESSAGTSSPSQNLVWEVKFGQELSTTTQKLKLLLPKPLEGSQCCVEDIVLKSDHRVSYFLLFHGSTEKEAITLGAVMKKFPLLSSPFCLKSFASS